MVIRNWIRDLTAGWKQRTLGQHGAQPRRPSTARGARCRVEPLEVRAMLAVDLSGNWQINGQATSIAQSGTSLTFTNEFQQTATGQLLSDTSLVATSWGNLSAQVQTNTIQWANNTTWTRVVTVPGTPAPDPTSSTEILVGATFNGRPTQIYVSAAGLRFVNEFGQTASGRALSTTQVIADSWGGLTGNVGGGQIRWANNTTWTLNQSALDAAFANFGIGAATPAPTPTPPTPTPTPTPTPPPTDPLHQTLSGSFGGRSTQIVINGAQLTFVNEFGTQSAGEFVNGSQVRATGWGNLIGTFGNGQIQWSNNTQWTGVDTAQLTAAFQALQAAAPPAADPPATPTGTLTFNGSFNGNVQVIVTPTSLTFVNEFGGTSAGRIINPTTVVATGWGNLQGTLTGNQIQWSNNTQWTGLDIAALQVALANVQLPSGQLTAADVEQLLARAAAATSSEDAIIAVVDRAGNILGVRTEQGARFDSDPALRVFAIDGAVAEARTAAFFSNNAAPLTSRTVRFISQSTVTQREVESNPNITDPNSTIRGPGFVAPIGLGGHFPPEVAHTPVVDLFGIEHTNRDSIIQPGPDNIRGTADDITLQGRFNIDPAYVPAGATLTAPESYGYVSGLLPAAQSRGIGTLPGGIPLYRNGELIGGIGVFFPGPNGYATYEQGFAPGQTEKQRNNASRALEAEYIAFAAAGGSSGAGNSIGTINGIPPLGGFDLPFGRIDLVGITLESYGPIAGITGVNQLVAYGNSLGRGNSASGVNQPISIGADNTAFTGDDVFYGTGKAVPEGWLVTAHGSAVDNITAADVTRIINQGIAEANQTRAQIRLPLGSAAKMVFAVTDSTGAILGLYRQPDATVFSLDVAVAKARNTAYYADTSALQAADQVPGIAPGVAFSNRTIRFLAAPRFPDGVDFTPPPVFSILNDPGINPATGENLGAPAPASAFQTVLGFDAFNPGTNFRDTANPENRNGVVFFPGSTPLYNVGALVGGFGASGDGVNQDDFITFSAAQGYLPTQQGQTQADQVFVNGVRLPMFNFPRNPRL